MLFPSSSYLVFVYFFFVFFQLTGFGELEMMRCGDLCNSSIEFESIVVVNHLQGLIGSKVLSIILLSGNFVNFRCLER